MKLLRYQEREGRIVQHFGECLYMIWCSGTTMYNNIPTQMQDEVYRQSSI